MYNFFVDESERQGNSFIITESDFNHISNVLRMKTGDEILVSCNGQASLCKIEIFYMFQFVLCLFFLQLPYCLFAKELKESIGTNFSELVKYIQSTGR